MIMRCIYTRRGCDTSCIIALQIEKVETKGHTQNHGKRKYNVWGFHHENLPCKGKAVMQCRELLVMLPFPSLQTFPSTSFMGKGQEALGRRHHHRIRESFPQIISYNA